MTPEQKELLIKDLCARLPYGVRGRDRFFDEKDMTSVIVGITYDDTCDTYLAHYEDGNVGLISGIDEFKPILFPLSAINEYLDINGEQICVRYLIEGNFKHSFYIESDGDIDIEGSEASYVYLEEYSFIIDTFNRYHIDYRDLIGKGLAISVFDLPENPYK